MTIPNTVTNIGSGAFLNCTSLTGMIIPGSITSIAYSGFIEVGMPAWAFAGCTNLESVYFQGDAPYLGDGSWGGAFAGYSYLTSYYLPGTIGWGSSLAGRPAVLWNPLIQTGDGGFGARNGQFGFNITGTTNIPIAVQACTNLSNPVWMPLATMTLTNGSVYFSELVQPNTPTRFYRIGSP
jgi:hypothetical protein